MNIQAIDQIKADYAEAWKNYTDLNNKFLDKNYEESFEDTLTRKYEEGFADALLYALNLLGSPVDEVAN